MEKLVVYLDDFFSLFEKLVESNSTRPSGLKNAKSSRDVKSFRQAGGENKPLYLQALHSYAESQEAALHNAWKLWRFPVLESDLQSELKTPPLFDEASHFVEPQNLTKFIRIGTAQA
jgi:hypothetical protein